MFVFGIVMALLGAILPSLAGRLQFETADIGTLFLVMNGAMLASSLALGLAMDRFGMKPPADPGTPAGGCRARDHGSRGGVCGITTGRRCFSASAAER